MIENMSASQIAGIQGSEPNLLGDNFYNTNTTTLVSSAIVQSLTQFADSIALVPGDSVVNIDLMPGIVFIASTTTTLATNTQKIAYDSGLNITTIDGDFIVYNGFVQSDTINVSTLNYQSLNPPISQPIVSSITSVNGYITEQTLGFINNEQTTLTLDNRGSSGGFDILGDTGGALNINQYLSTASVNLGASMGFNGTQWRLLTGSSTETPVNISLIPNSAQTNIVGNLDITGALTASTITNLNPLPVGISLFPDIAWNSTIGSEWVGTVSTPGVNEGSLISATLQLRSGYTYSDITTSEYCWLISTYPSTNTLTYFVASDPTGASSNVAVSWAVVR